MSGCSLRVEATNRKSKRERGGRERERERERGIARET